MRENKSIVMTVFGNNRKIEKISISLINEGDFGHQNAEAFCTTINSLELKKSSFVNAKILSENTLYTIDSFIPYTFSEAILKMESLSLQKVLRIVDLQEISKALKDSDENVQQKIFQNMSKRASKMLKEDMDYMGPVGYKESKDAQNTIFEIIMRLIDTGEVLNPFQD